MKKIHSLHLFALLVFCLFSKLSFSQRTADPFDTYGTGTTTNSTTYTNPDTFIPETKTDYQDANGVTRQETIKTKDYDGNTVIKEKIYDKTGKLIKETETNTDPKTGKLIKSESKEYGYDGRVINAGKFVREEGKFYFFDYDYQKQQYKNPRIVTSSAPNTDKKDMKCDNPNLRLSVGYSYLKAGSGGMEGSFPLGLDLGIGFRFNKNFQFVFDVSGHSSKTDNQTYQRFHGLAGVEFKREDCEKQPPISVFSRIAIGMMHDRIKVGAGKSSSGNAFVGSAGGGIDYNISKTMALRLSADYIPAFFKVGVQHNYRFCGGLNIGFGKAQ